MRTLIYTSLLLVTILVSLSSYLRLTHSGIGCADWPECYGQIGELKSIETSGNVVGDSKTAYQSLLKKVNQPLAWATPLHRLVASTLGLLVVILTIAAMIKKRTRIICLSVLGLTIYLAILGIRSGGLYDPAVIMGNLGGGFIMLGLIGWLAFNHDKNIPRNNIPNSRTVNRWALLALTALYMQILTGGLTSANFAATACTSFPDCHGSWLPDAQLIKAFDLSRQHQVNDQGIVTGGAERASIHKLHRLGAMLSVLLLLVTAIMAIRNGKPYLIVGMIILLLVIAEFVVGVLAVLSALPIALAVSHNWLAALLLLALIWILSLNRGTVSQYSDHG